MNERPSRRGLVKCLPVTAVALVPAAATKPGADPVFAAIAEHRNANAEWDRLLTIHNAWLEATPKPDGTYGGPDDRDPEWPVCEAAGERESKAHRRLWRTTPATPAGFAAWWAYMQNPRWPPRPGDEAPTARDRTAARRRTRSDACAAGPPALTPA
jgi:hypothetical protein